MGLSLNSFIASAGEAAAGSAARLLGERFSEAPLAFVKTFGCQQNVSDSERVLGVLCALGCGVAESEAEADIIVYNTCAVREGAESRVLGHIGALKALKVQNPRILIIICGCMTQREEMAERIRKSYQHVDIVLGASGAHRLPELIRRRISEDRRIIDITPVQTIEEGVPKNRKSRASVSVPIMEGCDNFCSYCIVPFVRGRERSREPREIIAEARELVRGGCREITLLGQNVNSYGKGLAPQVSFPDILREVNAIPGNFRISFMTSHPKDCSPELLDAVAQCEKVCRRLHLPVQSGSDRILSLMNRRYTREDYIKLVRLAREKIPGVQITSDIIVGFPGEQYEDFLQTLELIKTVRFTSLYTFLYSRRSGTAAAQLPDKISANEKGRWFSELTQEQEKIGGKIYSSYIGKTITVLTESRRERAGTLTGRDEYGIITEFAGESGLIGEFVEVFITGALRWALQGEIKK